MMIFLGTKKLLLLMKKITMMPIKQIQLPAGKLSTKESLHLIHLNMNSLLSKIDELWEIARKTRATVIGITESKLDGSVLARWGNKEG